MNDQTLGRTLAELREKSHLSLRNLSATTRIQEKYLSALEAGRYDALPDEIYVKSFVKSVAATLGEDPSFYLQKLAEELESSPQPEPSAALPIRDIPTVALTVTSTIIKRVLIGAVGAALILLGAIAVRATLRPPAIVLASPSDGMVATTPTVEVAGNVPSEADLRINGVRVTPNREGTFKEIIDLHQGTNLIKITAKKRHSKEAVVYRRVVYEPAP